MIGRYRNSLNPLTERIEMSVYAWSYPSQIWQSPIRLTKPKRLWSRHIVTSNSPQRDHPARKLFHSTHVRYRNDWVHPPSVDDPTNTKYLHQDQEILHK